VALQEPTTIEAPPEAAVTGAVRRRTRPVLIWATIGAACTVFALYVYCSWIVSGQAKRVYPGADPVPGYANTWALIFQICGPIMAAIAVIYVVRKCIRERRLCLDAMILIGTMIAWWHDPLINWLRPAVYYNATMLNFGSWTERIPGWISLNGRFMPEPVLMLGLAYIWMTLGFAMLATWAMRRARGRWPRLGAVGTFFAAWLVAFVLEIALEILSVRTGLVGYPAAPAALTLWAGHTYQLPVYGPLLWSGVLTSIGALRFFLNDRGQTVAERGSDRVPVGTRTRTLLRTLAVIGFVHVVAIVGYDLPVNLAGLYASPTETYPTYLRTQQCGPGLPTECPGSSTVVKLRNAP
jgi:hypothetical protein